MTRKEQKEFLDIKAEQYENPDFIQDDPISIPRGFKTKEDIEICGFLIATIAWGQRKTIIKNGLKLMELMDGAPHSFLMNMKEGDLDRFRSFIHRTFNGEDCTFFIQRLSEIYRSSSSLEHCLGDSVQSYGSQEGIARFKHFFLNEKSPQRTSKHVANPLKGSSAKRINMYLRWMVRSNEKGVDFGLWNKVSPSLLSLPLDVHTGNVARRLNLLKRNQNDWKAVAELDTALRRFDANDPVKYDFALFGLGVNEGWK